MFKKYELIGAGMSILCMATALYLIQVRTHLTPSTNDQGAQLSQSGVVVVGSRSDEERERVAALEEALDNKGNLKRMVIDDITIGEGAVVEAGSTVRVHYVGRLETGAEFDNSKKRGEPFEFTVGSGQVIKGWDDGLVGMRVGGERILVIPPELAYGEQGIGPIPGNATLVFAIELLEIK
jgi:FKBP-type peptidyl-prolyl cis-trans isomerase